MRRIHRCEVWSAGPRAWVGEMKKTLLPYETSPAGAVCWIPLSLLEMRCHVSDFVAAADDDRHPLMNVGGLHVEDA